MIIYDLCQIVADARSSRPPHTTHAPDKWSWNPVATTLVVGDTQRDIIIILLGKILFNVSLH